VHLLEARWSIKNKQNPQNAAKSAFQKLININSELANGFIGMAEYYFWLAQIQCIVED
jgi:hypothetical protein